MAEYTFPAKADVVHGHDTVCTLCFAVVPFQKVDDHVEWHLKLYGAFDALMKIGGANTDG